MDFYAYTEDALVTITDSKSLIALKKILKFITLFFNLTLTKNKKK